jgi:hypothetical protein
MGNTLSSNLVLDTISSRVVTPLGNIFAPLNAFTTDFSDEKYYQGQNVRFRYATTGPTAQTNPTNWESGDSVQDNVNLIVNQYSVSAQLSPLERNTGFNLPMLVDKAIQSFGNKIMDVAMGPLSNTNFSNITVAQSSLVYQNLQTVWAACAKSSTKNLILDSTALSVLMPKDYYQFDLGGAKSGLGTGGYGFDHIYLNTRWTGAGTNIYGFAGGPNSLGLISGLPVFDDEVRADLQMQTVSIPLGKGGTGQTDSGSSITVYASTWIARNTRIRWMSLDVMFGAAKIDNTGAIVFKSA